MADTQKIVLSIIGNYTNSAKVSAKSKLSELHIGPLDAESIRLDLEDEFDVVIGAGASIEWKKCKQIIVSVNRAINGKANRN